MAKIFPKFSGAKLNVAETHRYYLYRIWNNELPIIKYIGLNPSTANATKDDPTIRKLIHITDFNGYGGFYMFNLFTIVSPDPSVLHDGVDDLKKNIQYIQRLGKTIDIVFCWGNFKTYGRDNVLKELYPDAYVLGTNQSGSPKHPLYLPNETRIIKYPAE